MLKSMRECRIGHYGCCA